MPPKTFNVIIENDEPRTGFQARFLVNDRYRLTTYRGSSHGEISDHETDPDELRSLLYRPDRRDLLRDLLIELLDQYCLATPLYPIPHWNSCTVQRAKRSLPHERERPLICRRRTRPVC